jgi:hypothetical protein
MVPQAQQSSVIAGAVLPIKRAEELLQTLPGVLAARIIAGETGVVEEIHVLTTSEVTPKQTVRNIESALIAHLGMRVDHRKISVATTLEPPRESPGVGIAGGAARGPQVVSGGPAVVEQVSGAAVSAGGVPERSPASVSGGRDLYFEDVEVRRSRARGISCRVTLVRGDTSYVGEAEGMENERSRLELAARAALRAVMESSPGAGPLDLAGVRVVEAFDREFVFVGVTAQLARESVLLTGTCEVRDSSETASVLAVLDATNRWLAHPRRAAG